MSRNERKKMRDLKARSLIAHYHSKSPIAEQYRTIRTNVQFTAVDREMKTLMVTSPGPGDGKSTTVCNLAAVFAQQGKKVLLIDADMRRPTMHYTFRLNNTQGLTNVLTKQVTLEDAVNDTEIENLYVLPSGPVPPNPAELLGSESMGQLMEAALNSYDQVLFDTPPLLAVTDAQVMANRCDGVIMVVSSGHTEKEAAVTAKNLLEKARSKLLGVILNRQPMKKNHYYYYG